MLHKLNVRAVCREEFNVSVWRCPTFLFIVMGVATITGAVASSLFATQYADDPGVAALASLVVAAIIFTLGHIVIQSLTRILEASRMKSKFLNIISHQLLTPLTAMKWSLNALETDGIASDPKEREDIYRIFKENNLRMVNIINTLLDISRIDVGKVQLRPEPFDIAAYTKTAIAMHADDCAKKTCTMTFAPDDDIPPVFADPARLRIVIDNLIDNAVKYSRENAAIVVALKKDGGTVTFAVTDTGIGIPQHEHRHIFSKFSRASNVFPVEGKGLGMGLFLAKFIIEASGGTINFESREGVGSKFWFSLPAYTRSSS